MERRNVALRPTMTSKFSMPHSADDSGEGPGAARVRGSVSAGTHGADRGDLPHNRTFLDLDVGKGAGHPGAFESKERRSGSKRTRRHARRWKLADAHLLRVLRTQLRNFFQV